MQAECYVLYNDRDLDKHFILFNQTKLSISEIQQVWKAIKDLTRLRPRVCCSPLEIARQAGWDDSVNVYEMETRVKTAVAALEQAGYVKRGQNMPHVYATSILARNMQEASFRIDQSPLFSQEQRRIDLCRFVLSTLYAQAVEIQPSERDEKPVQFSLVGLFKEYTNLPKINLRKEETVLSEMEDALLYLSNIGSLKLEGGFLVLYNGIELKRLITDNRIKYKLDDYRVLDEFYKQKIHQFHIVGEYANLMVRDYHAALQFVQDYFQMDYRKFI